MMLFMIHLPDVSQEQPSRESLAGQCSLSGVMANCRSDPVRVGLRLAKPARDAGKAKGRHRCTGPCPRVRPDQGMCSDGTMQYSSPDMPRMTSKRRHMSAVLMELDRRAYISKSAAVEQGDCFLQ